MAVRKQDMKDNFARHCLQKGASHSQQNLRGFHATGCLHHQHGNEDSDAPRVHVTFVSASGREKPVEAVCGDNILFVAHKNGVDLEGACECSIACSTCHVILDDDAFDALPEACEDEEDMLDLAFGLTPTSRLGCQVIIGPEHEGMKIELPEATRNFYVDGHVPTPH